MLIALEEAAQRITRGEALVIAGDESVLSELPKGRWVGGSIPYFIGAEGGVFSTDRVFVTSLGTVFSDVSIREYSVDTIANIAKDAPENGLTFLILPASTPIHARYAQDSPGYEQLFLKPIVGWVSGVATADIGSKPAVVVDGATGRKSTSTAVALHGTLPPGRSARVGVINIFQQGTGDTIEFENDGFSVKDCLVAGKRINFADYLREKQVDTKLPLVADYFGTMVNVSFQRSDEAEKTVHFFAPVFRGVTYKFAADVGDYPLAFKRATASLPAESVVFSCNCILNYLYGHLEGKKTGALTGPVTFGEIAYQLLNQTLVYAEV